VSSFESAFALCMSDGQSLAERAELGLDFVTRHLNASGGAIYLRRNEQLVRVAATGDTDDDTVLRPWAARQLQREEREQHTELLEEGFEMEPNAGGPFDEHDPAVDGYTAVVLAHVDEQGFAVTGIMALRGTLMERGNEAAQLGSELSRVLKLAASASDPEPAPPRAMPRH
jgi:hypothetical protein